MGTLASCFVFQEREVITLIGSGGKTSLMTYLSQMFPKERVFAGTTTKIGYPPVKAYDYLYVNDYAGIGEDGIGVTMAGSQVAGKRKFGAVPEEVLQVILERFQKIILEGDGSKQLPLKGWRENEPIIISETTQTVGLVPVSSLGLTATTGTVHRLPLFLELTGLTDGAEIQAEHLAQMILHPNGLFREGKGRRILFLNQSDIPSGSQKAAAIATCLLQNGGDKQLDQIIAGSVQQKEGAILWQKN